MATAAIDKRLQALADVTGIIVDRTVTPEKVIGQGWIISKSRMVVLASSVANYTEAPWALLVKLPYPDLVFSVKGISLHPDFNKREARDHYLAHANELLPLPVVMDNDIATITLESEIPDLQPDRVQELNRALSLPLTISAQDLSGVMRAGDTGNILQKAVTSQRNGILNFFDERKMPFARLSIKSGRILKAAYLNLLNEFAICELMWRKPGGNFVLQSMDSFSWDNVPEITMSTEQLANEASRRTQDLPRMLEALGGPGARYLRTRPEIDTEVINQQIRWVVERVWAALDGALPLSKLSERLGVDSYTALQAIWELKHHGFVSVADFDLYHRSGQIGQILTPGHDVDLKFWDSLQAFFLDDLSTQPVTIQGNYFGSTSLLTPAALLHTMPVPGKYGAIVLKEGRLIGLHNGKFAGVMQNQPPFPLSQMTWIGSLADMSAKRMRTVTTDLDMEGLEEAAPVVSGRGTVTSLKVRAQAAAAAVAESVMPAPPDKSTPYPAEPSNEPEFLQKFNKIQMGIGGAAVGLLLGMVAASSMMAPKPAPVPVSTTPTGAIATATNTDNASGTSTSTTTATSTAGTEQKPDLTAAGFKPVLKMASFRDTPVPPFQFLDTSKDTAPKESFGLQSESANQKIYFVVWPNAVTTAAVDTCITQPPYFPLKHYDLSKILAEGTSPLHDFCWKTSRFLNAQNKETVAFVGAFPTIKGDKSILVLAVPFKGEGALDFKNTINVVERMFCDTGAAQGGGPGLGTGSATDADVQSYRQKVKDIIKSTYKAPSDSSRANKCVINFVVDSGGAISKLELKYSSGMEEVDRAVQKAVSAKSPYPDPPATKSGLVPMQLTVNNGELTIDEP